MRNDARVVPPLWISTVAYGKLYGIDQRTVRKWMAAGVIEYYQVGLTIRVLKVPPKEKA